MKILHYAIVLLFIATLWGCSDGNSKAPVTIDPITKKHAAGWALNGTGGTHPLSYFTNPASCEECHGKPSDPAGGISGVSCSNPGRSGVACHPAFPHAVGFAAYSRHGSVAKDIASGVTGMAHCKQCHGSSYTGATYAPSCVKCHNDYNASNHAPHAANWLSGNVNGLKHSTTDASNAPACAQCHLGGTYSHAPPVPAAPGTAPGCFNGTLCHNTAGHTFTVSGHQLPASSNLASCQPCHATPASGLNPSYTVPKNATLSPNGCEKCHNKPGIAHPFMWLPNRGAAGQQTASHANAGTVNASCGLCHGGTAFTGGSGPSCFSTPASSINGTTCHFTKPVDASGITVGCGSCHGAIPQVAAKAGLPAGTTAPNRAYRHTKHWAIPGITSAANGNPYGCNICHNGYGPPAVTHSNATISTTPVAAKFRNVSTAASSYDPSTGKCSNVACHGGRVFPTQTWASADPVLVPTDGDSCLLCHRMSNVAPDVYSGTPYIGPFSGNNISKSNLAGPNLHFAHVTGGFTAICVNCHNLTVHFDSLMKGRRTLAPGFAVNSLGGPGTLITYTYISPTSSSCLSNVAGCHAGETRSWNTAVQPL